MIDISKLTYQVALVIEDGTNIDISEAVTDLGWEEGEKELASRISAVVQNLTFNGRRLSELAKPGCLIAVLAGEEKLEEVARGVITEWEPTLSGKRDSFSLRAYDELFYLQKSQDNRYITAGTGTKSAITAIFDDWGIPYVYEGPDVPHAKTKFNSEYLSDILLELLEAAEKQGERRHTVRAEAGTIKIQPEGNNGDPYHFDGNTNLEVVKDKISTSNLITRVKVLGKEDKEGRNPVLDVLDGKTEYGIRQRIYHYTEADSSATAASAAKKVLDEYGEPERELTVEGPDVPFVRKGDKIHLTTRTAEGYYLVRAVKHDAATCSMSMKVEVLDEKAKAAEDSAAPAAPPAVTSAGFAKGDAVILNGALYRDSYGTGKGKTLKNHRETITIVVDLSRPCPYHLGQIGWVYPNTITKV